MMIRPGLLLALPLLAACPLLAGCNAQEPGDAPAGTPSPTTPAIAAQPSWTPPEQCPPWADPDRPEGSNCHGIMPERCGANRAAAFVGERMSPRVQAVLEGLAPQTVRIIAPGTAQTDDLAEGRLNVLTDAEGHIQSVDCF